MDSFGCCNETNVMLLLVYVCTNTVGYGQIAYEIVRSRDALLD